MVHLDLCEDHLNAVVTVAEAAYMYGISTRRMAVWCEDSAICARRTYGRSYLISLDDLLMRKGDPIRWPDSLSPQEKKP